MKTAVVTPASQVEKLIARMGEKGITHAGELRVDVPGVSVGKAEYPEGVTALEILAGKSRKEAPIFFCNIREITIRKILKDGDGGEIPDEAVVHGLNIEAPGRFDLMNAKVCSNGKIEVTVDEETSVVPVTQ